MLLGKKEKTHRFLSSSTEGDLGATSGGGDRGRGDLERRAERGSWPASAFFLRASSALVPARDELLHPFFLCATSTFLPARDELCRPFFLHATCSSAQLSVCGPDLQSEMDNRTKVLICAAVAHMHMSMMAMIIQSRKRKRGVPAICYGPMDERDRIRDDYLDTRVWKNDTTCINMLRLNKDRFLRFSKLFRDRGLLQYTIYLSVEQQVAMFLHTVGHILKNRLVGTNFDRSGETVNLYFNKVLRAIGELRDEVIRPSSLDTPAKIEGNPRWDPYFKDCVGAIDGMRIRASVPKDMEPAFRGRKSYCTQNVMAAIDFDLCFTYVLAGWEGTAHDALVLKDAL